MDILYRTRPSGLYLIFSLVPVATHQQLHSLLHILNAVLNVCLVLTKVPSVAGRSVILHLTCELEHPAKPQHRTSAGN